MKKSLTILSFLIGFGSAQYYATLVGNTNSLDATAYNNSHKIAVRSLNKFLNDTINVVYYSSDSLFYARSFDEGYHWQTPIYLGKGKHPAIDLDRINRPHIVYEYPDTGSGTIDIYYDCLDDTISPRKVNISDRIATLPDVVLDSTFTAHIVWQEDVNGRSHIYYRSYSMGSFSDTMRLSSYGSLLEDNTSPSISIFRPNKRIYVLWSSVDSSSSTPFHIYYRYYEMGVWSGINSIYGHFRSLGSTSLDYSHGSDIISACWEDNSTGNQEARFYGGNLGGGYPTQGISRYPVISTVGETWSYLFWDEDSSGFKDIYYHLYYVMIGWYGRGSIRNTFLINEPVRFPNACGAYVVWTQGNIPPYKVYFANFGYPIGIEENLLERAPGEIISLYPNPFANELHIKFQNPNTKSPIGSKPQIMLKIYDVSGRLVKQFNDLAIQPFNEVFWSGDDNSGNQLPPGVYFIHLKDGNLSAAKRAIKF